MKMEKIFRHILAAGVLCLAAVPARSADKNDRLVILHTNDTHSRIDPDARNLGGALRRAALIDSVRRAEPNVLLIDAGDAVQGTLYYSLFGGELERRLMNAMAYDIQILGNHEFDNGLESLARQWSQLNADRISTNYDVRATPLDTILRPYTMRTVDGRRIGFLAINLDPDGMISANNSAGVVYLDPIKAANATAWHLRHNERADMVVAVTHIGYKSSHGPGDLDLARASEDIDIIIGGHSHTLIDPAVADSSAWLVPNADGRPVLVAQTGALGQRVGRIEIDLATMKPAYSLLTVDSRLDSRVDPAIKSIVEPYRAAVDSLMAIAIITADEPIVKADGALVNLISDLVKQSAERLTGAPVDLALMNKGGIRCDMAAGSVTRGRIMEMLPFNNFVTVISLPGRKLAEAFDVMASRGGDGVSAEATAEFDPATGRCTSITVGGKPLDPDSIYTVATIDYLANGGDYMTPLKEATVLKQSDETLYNDIIALLETINADGRALRPDRTRRMRPATSTESK